jgi:ribonucleoside-diphosphate reductase alpha subunit
MKILKRNGNYETLSMDKVLNRIRKLTNEKPRLENVDSDYLSIQIVSRIYEGISSSSLDEIGAELAMNLSTNHPDYGELASRIIISNNHKNTLNSFSDTIKELYNNFNKNGKHVPLVSQRVYDIVIKNAERLNNSIYYSRDYGYDYLAYKSMEKGYLKSKFLENGKSKIIERPQHMLMRVALGIHKENIDAVIETYDCMSLKYFTHASPTLYNSGTSVEQNASCFLLGTNDSMKGIYKTISDCALISKQAGGIGIHITNIRAQGSYINGTNGLSDGIVPMLKVYNDTAVYCNQGSKRKGAFAIYIEPWHADIFDFLKLRLNTAGSRSAHDLFYGLWVPDLFMKQVDKDDFWYLMCPSECPGLTDVYGEEFDKLYLTYVEQNKYRTKIKARELWKDIIIAQIETGMPYMCYKDSVNRKNNQKHLGTIKSSNLCSEVMLYSNEYEYSVCTIATIGLPMFIKKDTIDFAFLGKITRVITRNLNKVIDNNYYPVEETRVSNVKHRPIIIGIQGLYDTFMKLYIPFESDKAKMFNKKIFETIQYHALSESMELSKKEGPYESFKGSPASQGILQHNMWGIFNEELSKLTEEEEKYNLPVYDWENLSKDIKIYGLRNSLVTAQPPTATTSSILGNTESIEPITTHIYTRHVLSGTFVVINKNLIKELIKRDLWNISIKNKILYNKGSIQNIDEIPDTLKFLYKTIWEIPQKTLISLAADRSPFIDHSQSLNSFIKEPNYGKVSSMHFFAWRKGLKTGMYYLRSRPSIDPEQFTVNSTGLVNINTNNKTGDGNGNGNKINKEEHEESLKMIACSIDNKEACESCSG